MKWTNSTKWNTNLLSAPQISEPAPSYLTELYPHTWRAHLTMWRCSFSRLCFLIRPRIQTVKWICGKRRFFLFISCLDGFFYKVFWVKWMKLKQSDICIFVADVVNTDKVPGKSRRYKIIFTPQKVFLFLVLCPCCTCNASSAWYWPADPSLCYQFYACEAVLEEQGIFGGRHLSLFAGMTSVSEEKCKSCFCLSCRCVHRRVAFLPASSWWWHHQSGAARILSRQLPG